MKYSMRIHEETDLEVTWIHHWKKKGNSSTLTRPFLVRAVQGLCGLALLNVDPEGRNEKVSYTAPTKPIETFIYNYCLFCCCLLFYFCYFTSLKELLRDKTNKVISQKLQKVKIQTGTNYILGWCGTF